MYLTRSQNGKNALINRKRPETPYSYDDYILRSKMKSMYHRNGAPTKTGPKKVKMHIVKPLITGTGKTGRLHVYADVGYNYKTRFESTKIDVQAKPIGPIRKPENVIPVSEQPDQEIKKLDDEDKEIEEVINIAKHKGRISFSHELKSESFAKKLAAAIPSTMTLKKLKFRNCVTSNFLEIFSEGIDSREIRTLDLSGNKNLDLRVVEGLRNKMNSKVLDLSNAELDAKEILKLGEIQELEELRLNYKAFKHGSIAAALVKLINNGIQVLSLVDSKISGGQLRKIADGLKDRVCLRVLDLSHVALKQMGVEAVVKIVNKSEGMDKLVLSHCAITTTLLESFKELVKRKVTALDVSSNADLANGPLDVLSSLADKVNCEALDISSISLDGNKIGELLKTTSPKHLKKLTMIENPGVDFVAVGELVTQWRILELDISECRPSSEAILKMANSIGDHKLDSIDISDPMGTVNDEKQKALQALSRKTKKIISGNHEEYRKRV